MLSSIKSRVAVFYTAVLISVLAVLGVSLYLSLYKIVFDAVDAGILSRAKALATLVSNEQDEIGFKFSDDIMWEYNFSKANSFFQIRTADGRTIEKSASLEGYQLPWNGKGDPQPFQTIRLKGIPVRLVNLIIQGDEDHSDEAGKPENQRLIIQCAESIQEQSDLLLHYKHVLALAILIIMFISTSGGLLIAAKALSPIGEISRTIDRISEANLAERVAVENIPKELKILAASFNRTLDSLEKSFLRQRQFIADASHELKTPLSVIISQSEITLRKERTSSEYRNALSSILHTSTRMSGLVRRLLAAASLRADKAELTMEDIDLGSVLHESVKLLRPVSYQNGIEMRTSIPGSLFIRGNREALLEVLVNIIDNAIKYNIPQGHVHVSLDKVGNWAVTTVQDSGIGIPAQDMKKVFDRFYRVDKSRSGKTGGSGLGLSIADEIVKLHGGRIELSSQVGIGTEVSVSLMSIG
jgi:signal transduction histidine kinase